MTTARPNPQTTCVTERLASMCAGDLTACGSSCVDMTATGGDAIGTSAIDVVSVGEQFQFPMPGNG